MPDFAQGWREQRSIHLFSTIDNNQADQVIKQILGLAAFSKDPIRLWLNCQGGEIPHAMAIVQVMAASPAPVYTIALGRVFSAALFILVTGKKRTAFSRTLFMAHHFFGGQPNTQYENLKASRVAEDWLDKQMLAHYKKYTKSKNEKVLRRLYLGDDFYFNEEEAVTLGCIDSIISKIDVVKVN